VNPQLGIRYLPEFGIEKYVSESSFIDAEFSLNAYGFAQFKSSEDIQTDGNIDPYRLWLRFSTSRFEARIGLQKINFGSATLLRPMMWFDSVDPRDPLQLTDGVYAFLVRYYFINNANIWLWGLYGDDKTKGWESIPTVKNSVEYGGRFQLPLLTGELALTYHHRQADLSKAPFPLFGQNNSSVPEDRLGVDGKWDMGIGFWLEGVLVRQESNALPMKWQRAMNIGLDYTFNLGNGINCLGEHFRLERARDAFASGENIDFSALMLRYPFGILDEISCILYYDWDNKDFYRFINWQRTYDRWRLNLIVFWNPDDFLIYPNQAGASSFSGRGFQVMIVFNY